MKFITVLIVLVIIAALYFVITPNAFEKVRDNVKGLSNLMGNNENVVLIDSGQSCVDTDFNTIICKSTCHSSGMEYITYNCESGGAICSCER